MRVNPSDPTPGYIQIADHLRRAIERRDLADGAQLPSLRELVEEYGTSAGTVRQAIDQLKGEGLVISRQGQGVFVRRPQRLRREGSTRHLQSARPPGLAPLEAEADAQGFHRDQELVEVTTVGAPDDVAAYLGVDPGTPTVVRRHLLTLDGEPAQTADSYFPADLVHGSRIGVFEKIPGGVHAELARVTGRKLGFAAEELVARMPTPAETRTLRLPSGTPVVDLTRTIHDTDGNPLEVSRFVFDGSRHLFAYRVPFD